MESYWIDKIVNQPLLYSKIILMNLIQEEKL